jgi:hypothetical protein
MKPYEDRASLCVPPRFNFLDYQLADFQGTWFDTV